MLLMLRRWANYGSSYFYTGIIAHKSLGSPNQGVGLGEEISHGRR